MKTRPDCAGTAIHVFQSHSTAFGRFLGQSATIVDDTEDDSTGATVERDADFGGFPVDDAVMDGFLGDAVEMNCGPMVPNTNAVG